MKTLKWSISRPTELQEITESLIKDNNEIIAVVPTSYYTTPTGVINVSKGFIVYREIKARNTGSK